ncbi:MAG: hypothetical protein LBB88_00430 [Planctomycetaceae bacterium]|jgi:hypothetical protein|nr:hypothetical protein [Planctomycetaceae bacterium]
MNRQRSKISNIFFRLLMAAAILLNVVAPSMGTCNCVDCPCCRNSDLSEISTASDDMFANKTDSKIDNEVDNKTNNNLTNNNSADNKVTDNQSCCSLCVSDLSKEIIVTEKSCCLKPENNSNTIENCCQGGSSDNGDRNNKRKSDSCPCSLKAVSDISRYFLKTTISFQKVLDGWKVDLYSSSFQLIYPIRVTGIEYGSKSFDTPISRLPLRLHLFLLVLLN